MRLDSIRLIGFKSFVDPTTLAFPSNLTAVVGPNGCGKSNIIDAIRWVMGESSAKQLRGQSLDDVIFNGCSTRKPLGQAAIELNFDNSDASLGGQYSSYAQLSIRREITRDGQSTYFLNGTRCRRRDIRDIFLGTGLGPRSYAIIEQGMISRLIEAKPDELRAYIEEAAGISKYKERRRETENRLAHTEENLNRLNDVREELEKQGRHLQRQAKAAEDYKRYKQEERQCKAQLHALRYRDLHKQIAVDTAAIVDIQAHLDTLQQEQAALTQARNESLAQQEQSRAAYEGLQNRYYALGTELSRLEEKVQHQQQQSQQYQQDIRQLSGKERFLQQQIAENQTLQTQLQASLAQLKNERDTLEAEQKVLQAKVEACTLALNTWQAEWDTFQEKFAHSSQQVRVAQTQVQHYQQQQQRLAQQLARLTQEQTTQETLIAQESDVASLEAELQTMHHHQQQAEAVQTQLRQQINEQHALAQQLTQELDTQKSQLQTTQGQLASRIALQEEALGKHNKTLNQWLKQHELLDSPRLAQQIQVEAGWERAVEVALGSQLQAICFNNPNALWSFLQQERPQQALWLMAPRPQVSSTVKTAHQAERVPLTDKLTAPWSIDSLLTGIYVVNRLEEAYQQLDTLADHESILTQDGVQIGKYWIRFSDTSTQKSGLLQREREIQALQKTEQSLRQAIETQQARLTEIRAHSQQLEEQYSLQQKQLNEGITRQAELKTRYQVKTVRLTQAQQRLRTITQECTEHQQQQAKLAVQQQLVEQTQQTAQAELAQLEVQRQGLLEDKTRVQTEYQQATQALNTCAQQKHQLELRDQSTQHQSKTAQETAERLKQQQEQAEKRRQTVETSLQANQDPLHALEQQLTLQRAEREELGTQLAASQTHRQTIEQQLKDQEKRLEHCVQQHQKQQEILQQKRLTCQEWQVRAQTQTEQLREQEQDLDSLLQALPEEAEINDYEAQLETLTRRIEKLGAVNLAALEEHQALLERKSYLDTQFQDLNEALEILRTAIQKMDKETRHCFKETFDHINENFKALFPRLFSGGEAYLELQEADLLNSGVCVMARPPGKRNSSIHLLSGGEKALTATALVFSFFQLNPAPFCILDEVDAPLDDSNVLRFCHLVKEMSKEVQFIFISHNKVAIEMAQHLAGVTMHEPGVSRLVAVDVEKAIAIAQA